MNYSNKMILVCHHSVFDSVLQIFQETFQYRSIPKTQHRQNQILRVVGKKMQMCKRPNQIGMSIVKSKRR